MPNAVVKSYAKETGKSAEHIERWWKEAEAQALKKFKKSDPSYWPYVNGIVERRGKLVHGKRKGKKRKTNEGIDFAAKGLNPREMSFKKFLEELEATRGEDNGNDTNGPGTGTGEGSET